MYYELEIEFHGVAIDAEISVDENGAIETLHLFDGEDTIDCTDLLKNQDVYNSVERDHLNLLANMAV